MRIIASDTALVKKFDKKCKNRRFGEFFDPKALVRRIASLLVDEKRRVNCGRQRKLLW